MTPNEAKRLVDSLLAMADGGKVSPFIGNVIKKLAGQEAAAVGQLSKWEVDMGNEPVIAITPSDEQELMEFAKRLGIPAAAFTEGDNAVIFDDVQEHRSRWMNVLYDLNKKAPPGYHLG